MGRWLLAVAHGHMECARGVMRAMWLLKNRASMFVESSDSFTMSALRRDDNSFLISQYDDFCEVRIEGRRRGRAREHATPVHDAQFHLS